MWEDECPLRETQRVRRRDGRCGSAGIGKKREGRRKRGTNSPTA